MSTQFSKSIETDLFIECIQKFCRQVSYTASSCESIDNPIFGGKMTLFDINLLKDRIKKDFSNVENGIIDNCKEFSKADKFFYLAKLISEFNQYKLIFFANDFSKFRIKLKEYFDNFYKERQYSEEDLPYIYLNDCLTNDKDEYNFSGYFKTFFEESTHYFHQLMIEIERFIFNLYQGFFEGHQTNETHLDVLEYVINELRPVFVIPENFSLSKLRKTEKNDSERKFKLTELSKTQSVLLFDYLCDYRVFLAFDASSKAKLANFLTGYSEKTLRTEGFAFVEQIKSGKKSSNPHEPKDDLKKVRDLLQSIVNDMNNTIGE